MYNLKMTMCIYDSWQRSVIVVVVVLRILVIVILGKLSRMSGTRLCKCF